MTMFFFKLNVSFGQADRIGIGIFFLFVSFFLESEYFVYYEHPKPDNVTYDYKTYTWFKANNLCKDIFGTSLPTITSEEENEDFGELRSFYNLLIWGRESLGARYWIGWNGNFTNSNRSSNRNGFYGAFVNNIDSNFTQFSSTSTENNAYDKEYCLYVDNYETNWKDNKCDQGPGRGNYWMFCDAPYRSYWTRAPTIEPEPTPYPSPRPSDRPTDQPTQSPTGNSNSIHFCLLGVVFWHFLDRMLRFWMACVRSNF